MHPQVMMVLGIQMVSLLAVCLLQFVNTMILGSLALSFIVASFIIILRKVSSLDCSPSCVAVSALVGVLMNLIVNSFLPQK